MNGIGYKVADWKARTTAAAAAVLVGVSVQAAVAAGMNIAVLVDGFTVQYAQSAVRPAIALGCVKVGGAPRLAGHEA